jgi:WD40 repeat protein
MNSSDSLQLDENLARFLAAYDQNLDGGNSEAITVDQRFPAPPSDSGTVDRPDAPSNQGSMGDLLPDESRAPKDPSPAPPVGPHRIGRFELRKQLGKGGCGIVFLAYDPKLEREVALKVPRPEMFLNPDAKRRLVREALAAAEFDHPNLVPVYETGEMGPMCYIATAFCPGQTLAQWIDKQAFPVPVRQAARLVATLAEAVQHAHDRGVLHRDLKPNNVILQELKVSEGDDTPAGSVQLRGEHFLPRVVDFGLAKLADRGGPSDTATRQILGTPKYMAPEQAQARREDIGPPADVYALGVILYELITGRAPYEGASDVEILRQAVEGKPALPRALRADVPRDLEAICLKAMARRTAERYRTAIDLADDLRRFLDGRPTVARPLAWSGRAARWFKRNDQLVAIAVLMVVALFVTGLASWNTYVSSKLRKEYGEAKGKEDARERADREREYAQHLRSAFDAWAGGNAKPAADALEAAARTAAALNEQPDFAHAYLSRLVRAGRLHIVCPAGAVSALAVSPDGKRLATGHPDGTVCVWDRATGAQLGSIQAQPRGVKQLAFALGGELLISRGETDDARQVLLGWLVTKDGALAPAAPVHRDLGSDAHAFAVSPDGKALYAGGHNGLLFKRTFGAAAPVVARAAAAGQPPVYAIAVTDDGASVWVADGSAALTRYTAGLARADDRSDNWGAVPNVLVTNASGLPLFGHDTGFVDVQPACMSMPGHTGGPVHWLARGVNGSFALNGPAGVVLLNGYTRLPTGDLGAITAGAFAPSGAVLFTGSSDGIVRAWDVARDARERAAEFTPRVRTLAVSADGSRYFTQTAHHATRFDVQGGSKLLEAPKPLLAARPADGGEVDGVTFDGPAVVVSEFTGNTSIERVRFALPRGHLPTSAALSADSLRLAVGDSTGRVSVWNLTDRELAGTVETGTGMPVGRVELSSDGRSVAAPAKGGVSVWTVGAAEPVMTCAADAGAAFRFVPGGERFATAGRDGAVRVWNLMGREELTLFGHVGRVTGLGTSPDGRTLVSGGANGEVRFWDARTGQPLFTMRRHTSAVTHIEFAANGKLLVTAGDGHLALWDARGE